MAATRPRRLKSRQRRRDVGLRRRVRHGRVPRGSAGFRPSEARQGSARRGGHPAAAMTRDAGPADGSGTGGCRADRRDFARRGTAGVRAPWRPSGRGDDPRCRPGRRSGTGGYCVAKRGAPVKPRAVCEAFRCRCGGFSRSPAGRAPHRHHALIPKSALAPCQPFRRNVHPRASAKNPAHPSRAAARRNRGAADRPTRPAVHPGPLSPAGVRGVDCPGSALCPKPRPRAARRQAHRTSRRSPVLNRTPHTSVGATP